MGKAKAELTVIRPGCRVRLGIIEAIVSAVSISANDKVLYQVIWWNERERKEVWVEAFEVEPVNEALSVMPIGFVNHKAG